MEAKQVDAGNWVFEGPEWMATMDEDRLTDTIFNDVKLEHQFTGSKAEARALARVMLAGPGLLAALREILDLNGELTPSGDPHASPIERRVFDAARAAIADARS